MMREKWQESGVVIEIQVATCDHLSVMADNAPFTDREMLDETRLDEPATSIPRTSSSSSRREQLHQCTRLANLDTEVHSAPVPCLEAR